jgi:hypothetical protein
MMTGVRKFGVAFALAGAAALVYAAFEPVKLTINGSSGDTDVIMKNGRAYVPLADVAKALGDSVAKSAGAYTLDPPGGANQVEGLNAKIGQLIKTPYFTFIVQKVLMEDHHEKLFTTGSVDAPDGQTLAIIVCRVKNATQKTLLFNPFGFDKTALTDQDEHTLGNQYTGGGADAPSQHELLPGSAMDFALVFPVPKGTQLKDLVYEFDGGIAAHPILRISLAQP